MPPPTISRAEAFLVDLEVETVRTDAVQSFLKQETIFVQVETTDGLTGLGYSYTIGTGGSAVLARRGGPEGAEQLARAGDGGGQGIGLGSDG